MEPNSAPNAAQAHEPDSSSAWRRFWATGVVDTFGSTLAAFQAPVGTQSPPLFHHWRTWLSGLPAEGELLDLGCGNGALLCHLLLAGPGDGLRGVGVDLAQPSADWMASMPPDAHRRVQCRGGISAEQLPFEPGRFHACASQFGIEYADLSLAVPEALRVLRTDAHLGWALHHAGGRPAHLAREELSHVDWLEYNGWLAAAKALVSAAPPPTTQHAAVQTGAGSWMHARARMEELLAQLKQRVTHSSCPDLLADVATWTNHAFGLASRLGQAAGHSALRQIQTLISDTRTRLLDLTTHTLDESAWEELLRLLRSNGVVLGPNTGPLLDRGHLMGWWMHGQLSGPPMDAASVDRQ